MTNYFNEILSLPLWFSIPLAIIYVALIVYIVYILWRHRSSGYCWLSAVTLAAFCLTSCDDESDYPDLKPATTMSLTVNGEHYDIDLTSSEPVNLRTLTVEFPSHFKVNHPLHFPNLTIGGKKAQDGDCYLQVDNISHSHQIEITYTDAGKTGKTHKVLLNTLHKRVPPIITAGKSTSKGDFYLSFVYLRLIEKRDNEGRLLYYRFEPLDNLGDGNTGWWDFKKHHADDGKTYYSYHEPDSKFASLVMSGFNPGKRIIMDESYNKIKEIQLLAAAQGVCQGDPVDGHDFYMYNPQHYIVSSYIKRTSTQNKDIYGAYLQEVENGQVVFDWWSTNHPEMEDWVDPIFTESEPDLKDYVHYNSIDILPDGNWLCSFRHSSSIVKIDRVGGTGDFLWRVAGADNDGSYSFHGQHYVRYHKDDHTVSIFNNGNDRQRTQLLRLNVNVDDGTVSGSHVLRDDGYFTEACGALVFSGNNTIAGWGIPGNNDDCHRLLTEYDQSGTEIFSISWPLDSKVDSFYGSYRCVKCE